MKSFWQFARSILHYRKLLLLTAVAAIIDALCAAGGFASLTWVIQQFFNDGQTARQLVEENIQRPWVVQWFGDLTPWIAWVPSARFNGFVFLIGVIVVLVIIGSAFRFIYQYSALTICFRAVMVVRKRVFQRLVHLPQRVIDQEGTADTLSRVVNDSNRLARGFNTLLGKAVRDILMGCVALGVALLVDWVLTLIFVGCLPVIAVVIRKFGKRIRRASHHALQQYGRMVGALQESLQALTIVKIHQAEGYQRRRFNAINRQVYEQEMRARLARALNAPVVEAMAIFGVAAVAIVAAWYALESQPDEMISVLVLLGLAGASFRPLANLNNDLQEAAAAATRLDEVLQLPVESTVRRQKDPGRRLPRHRDYVEFDQVTFTYPNTDQPALNEVSLKVNHGQTCAIVGGNGSGKSTLLSLLPRLHEPDTGGVIIDGHNIAECSLRSVRQQIAMVSQQTVLFDGTIADNLIFGSTRASHEQMLEAARIAHVDRFVDELPHGYETPLGEWGGRLSGGQRQRIAIARAILRRPSILILDEATSQIDTESEAMIASALSQAAERCTTFVIAHRLSTVIDADQIAVMDHGRIIDVGKHHELLERCATYQTLCQMQLTQGTTEPTTGRA